MRNLNSGPFEGISREFLKSSNDYLGWQFPPLKKVRSRNYGRFQALFLLLFGKDWVKFVTCYLEIFYFAQTEDKIVPVDRKTINLQV
jgi:hypothetical protein